MILHPRADPGIFTRGRAARKLSLFFCLFFCCFFFAAFLFVCLFCFIVLNLFYSFAVVYQWFISRKAIIFQGF